MHARQHRVTLSGLLFGSACRAGLKSHMVVITEYLLETRERAIAVVKTNPNYLQMTSRGDDTKPLTPRTDVTNKHEWEREFFVWKKTFAQRQRQIKPVGLVEESVKPLAFVLALLLAAVPGVFPATDVVRLSLKSFLLADHQRRGLPPTRL